MNIQEASRITLGLHEVGWDSKQIENLLLWVETGDPKYAPKGLEDLDDLDDLDENN